MYDCTDYGVNELSLVVYNAEFLYKRRYILTPELLNDFGIKYTTEQWHELLEDLKSEENSNG